MKKDYIISILVFIKEITIIMAIYLFGEGIVHLLNIEFPGSVVGMLLLLLALHSKLIKLEDINRVSSFLLKYMTLFFIPAGVSIMNSYGLMQGHYVKIILIIIVSTFITMSLTSVLVQILVNRRDS